MHHQTIAIQEQAQRRTRHITASRLIGWSGLAAMTAGILFIAIQAIHPLDVVEAVTSTRWAIAHYIGIAMCLLGLLGVTGIYARQIEQTGWLGLLGYLLFSLFYALSLTFQLIEAALIPLLASATPTFTEGFLGIATGRASAVNLGALPTIYTITGLAGYLLGGLLLGIATLRAGILPRWAAGLLIFGIVLPVLGSSLVPHPYDRIFAVPVGLALAGLGYALWSEQRAENA